MKQSIHTQLFFLISVAFFGSILAWVLPGKSTGHGISSKSNSAINCPRTVTPLMMARSRFPVPTRDESKRQQRVARVIQTELSEIIYDGYPVKARDILEDDVRTRISVTNVDMSPDLANAVVYVSCFCDDLIDKRRAFSWLTENNKNIRHALAQRVKHMKRVPSLTFRREDLSRAVDVMALIDRVSNGEEDAEGQNIGSLDAIAEEILLMEYDGESSSSGMAMGMGDNSGLEYTAEVDTLRVKAAGDNNDDEIDEDEDDEEKFAFEKEALFKSGGVKASAAEALSAAFDVDDDLDETLTEKKTL